MQRSGEMAQFTHEPSSSPRAGIAASSTLSNASTTHGRNFNSDRCLPPIPSSRIRVDSFAEHSRGGNAADTYQALLEWSASIHDVVTVSIHTYERVPQLLSIGTSLFRAELRVDPLFRCPLPKDCLAILPFYQSQAGLDVMEQESNQPRDVPYSRVAHATHRRLEEFKDTGSLAVDGLPCDCFALTPCSTTTGGVIILASNAILFVDQPGCRVILPVNGWPPRVSDLAVPSFATRADARPLAVIVGPSALLRAVKVEEKLPEADVEMAEGPAAVVDTSIALDMMDAADDLYGPSIIADHPTTTGGTVNGDRQVPELTTATGSGHLGSFHLFQKDRPTRSKRKLHAIGGTRPVVVADPAARCSNLPRHQLEFVVEDTSVLQDSLKLVLSFFDPTQGQISLPDRKKIETSLWSSVPLFFMIDSTAFNIGAEAASPTPPKRLASPALSEAMQVDGEVANVENGARRNGNDGNYKLTSRRLGTFCR
ncbi:hypothetical protein LXA43DRAFT_1069248 [Ganoderma leucocontextum]|nr:hypothetical protein LXA43DRAFT_1069248 [Ganoderma leucocontextum]